MIRAAEFPLGLGQPIQVVVLKEVAGSGEQKVGDRCDVADVVVGVVEVLVIGEARIRAASRAALEEKVL